MVTQRALCAWWLALWCRPHHQKASGGFLVTSQNMLPSARDAFWTLAKAPCGCADLVGLNACALRTNARYRAASQVRRRHTETKRSNPDHPALHVAAVLQCNVGYGFISVQRNRRTECMSAQDAFVMLLSAVVPTVRAGACSFASLYFGLSI